MEAAVGLGVGDEAPSLLVVVAAVGVVVRLRPCEGVVVDEVVARVVGRVDVDHLHLAGVGVAQELERVEVVTLDVQVLSRVPVHALLGARAQALVYLAVRLLLGLALARPGELVALPLALGDVAHALLEGVDVDGVAEGAVGLADLGHDLGEELCQLLDVLVKDVRCRQIHVLHHRASSSIMLFSIDLISSHKALRRPICFSARRFF